MGWIGGAAAVLVSGALLFGLARTEGFSAITGAVLGTPGCDLQLADGSVVEAAPEQAAAWTTAAVRGEAVAELPAPVAMGVPGAVACRIPVAAGLAAEPLGPLGLTARAATVRDEVRAVFGRVPDGGFAPGGIGTGHGARSAHYDGRAVDFFFRPVGDPRQLERGWAVANWLVANGQRLQVAVVIFDDQIWSARRSAQGWRDYRNPTGATDPISRHLDHVHVDVIKGG
jgi:hypothetical protein